MTPFFANYGYHPQTEWLKEREAQNPGANMYGHWCHDPRDRGYISYVILGMLWFGLFHMTHDSESLH